MSSSGGSPASSRSTTNTARGAVLALLRQTAGATIEERYRAATLQTLTLLAAHLAARRGLGPAPTAGAEWAPSLADRAESPHRLLTAVYEDLLRVAPAQENGLLVLRPSRVARKRSGSYFTPGDIAARVVHKCLEGAPLRPLILDPAMGTGVFLVEAARQAAPSEDRARYAETCLFGIDLDPVAVHIAVLSLWLETGASPQSLSRHLLHGDSLSQAVPVPRPDVVMGNPPWGLDYTPEERRSLMERYPRSATDVFDSAKVFVDLGSRLSCGTLGMILPQAFLIGEKHADVRRLLLDRMAPRAALDLGNAFPGAAAPACAVVFGQKPGPEDIEVEGSLAPACLWSEESFPLRSADVLAVVRRLQSEFPLLGGMGLLLQVRDVGLNYNRASVSRRSLYTAEVAAHPLDRPRYRGRNFSRYSPIRRGGWLRHDAERSLLPGESLSYCRHTASLPEKIVLRQTADRPIATLDRTRMITGRSVLSIVCRDSTRLLPFLAFLNSAPVTALYRALAGEEGRILPQVKVARLHALPVPPLGESDGRWTELGRLAARLLACSGTDREADCEVDALVAEMYGLSEVEAELLRQPLRMGSVADAPNVSTSRIARD